LRVHLPLLPPSLPFTPEEPELPLVPEEPLKPDVPEEPSLPLVPEEPELPLVPEEPELPFETPEITTSTLPRPKLLTTAPLKVIPLTFCTVVTPSLTSKGLPP